MKINLSHAGTNLQKNLPCFHTAANNEFPTNRQRKYKCYRIIQTKPCAVWFKLFTACNNISYTLSLCSQSGDTPGFKKWILLWPVSPAPAAASCLEVEAGQNEVFPIISIDLSRKESTFGSVSAVNWRRQMSAALQHVKFPALGPCTQWSKKLQQHTSIPFSNVWSWRSTYQTNRKWSHKRGNISIKNKYSKHEVFSKIESLGVELLKIQVSYNTRPSSCQIRPITSFLENIWDGEKSFLMLE